MRDLQGGDARGAGLTAGLEDTARAFAEAVGAINAHNPTVREFVEKYADVPIFRLRVKHALVAGWSAFYRFGRQGRC